MSKKLFLTRLIAGTLTILSLTGAADATTADAVAIDDTQGPALPTDYRQTGGLTLNYDDYDYILERIVMRVGRSDHIAASKPSAGLGSRFIADNPDPSRLEGNRVMFHTLREPQRATMDDLRDAYLALPARVPLEKLSKNEQLAYWFNLHNMIVLSEIAHRYPTTDISKLWSEDCTKETAFSCERRYKFGDGPMISLDDIRHHVLANWHDPLVIYGFYMGAVGTPNIRTRAYRGDEVWQALKDNASDFVNSVRGTRLQGSHKLRVSTYYRMMAAEFPNFDIDLMKHIRAYANGSFRDDLATVDTLKVGIDDWHIADLYNGHLTDINNIETVGTVRRYPPQVTRLLTGILERNRNREGRVDVEEMFDAPAPAAHAETDQEIAVKPDPQQ